ncbi:hypothetical protein CR207_08595 [Chromobacterium violaceum]|uniref:DUF1045 domain-containing protein n=1 Tax=Chromobacterium violaceum TaxID=536 RepID=UPI000C126C12|nr:DUF1045 domain-containing protein [Chromobacterium violaceum]ATP28449.1 hypothetical protein CRN81_08575 [Chromobacterium violaceum]ATP32359.1 hypothetical protein CR207_08595 [Chromobacterium violaceum]
MMRYAAYYAPRPDSALWRAGCEWLGYDAAGGAQLPRPDVEGVEAGELACLTREAARYGWHATLKAPFALRPGVGEDALLLQTSMLARRFQPFALSLQVGWLGDFLALRPAGPCAELDELAAACSVSLEGLADRHAPLRPREGLDPRQQALYRRWGYPYVFEQFRFHLTLSDRLDRESAAAVLIERGARRHFAGLLQQVAVAGVTLFVEREQGAPFRYLAHCGFNGEVARHGG